MTKIASAFSFTAIVVGAALHASAAGATANLTWVSGVGLDSNPCTRASPCATLQHAYLNTAAGGEIDVLDGGDFGPLTIDHAITIANDGTGTAEITRTGAGSGIVITAVSIDVVLRGLTLRGFNASGAGVAYDATGSLLIDHCVIKGFQSQPAISFEAQGAATLWVRDTVLISDGSSPTAGLQVAPQNSGVVTAHVQRVHILNAAGNGIRVDGTHASSPTDVELRDVTVDGATGGSAIVAVSTTSGGPTVKIVADNVTSSHNAGFGFRAVGGTASVFLSRSVSENNGIGVGVSSGGQVFSYGDNRFANNTSGDGVTPTPIGLK
jgi:hypothetical protein